MITGPLRAVADWGWQLGRKWIPTPVKRWIKEKVLRQEPPPWVPPAPMSSPKPRKKGAASYDLIIFPIIEWRFRTQRPQHVAGQFAKNGHRVFYVSPVFTPDGASANRADHLLEANILEVRLPGPVDLNIYRDKATEQHVQAWVEAFERIRREYEVVNAVCMVHLPFWTGLVLELRDRFGWLVVYDCMDRHRGFSTNRLAMLGEESRLVSGSDLIFTTSVQLQEEHRRHGRASVLVPNACDYRHFATCVAPFPLSGFPRPIVGYYGAIAEWFNTQLVGEMARLKPDWSFVLIGSTARADLEPLAGLANVTLLGEQPYERLPAFLHGFDVCLIPFHINSLTEATDPVKFYEYLSAGKPVVSVPLPELLRYREQGLVYLGQTAASLVQQAERALNENGPHLAARRRLFAEKNTWEARFKIMHRAIRYTYPRASIVVVTYNNLHLTQACVDSILGNTVWPNYELILVDNASTDGTQPYLQSLKTDLPNAQVVLNRSNEGFAAACNRGLQMASGDYIVVLNNDVVVTRGWLTGLVRHLERDPRIAMVGPVTNSVGNEALVEGVYSNLEELEVFALRRMWDYQGQSFEIRMLAMFCVLMRRQLLDHVGLLDERFGVGLFEDDDLAVRAKRTGYKLVCCEDVFVHHFHGAGFKLSSAETYWTLFEANRASFESKWRTRWEPHTHRSDTSPARAGSTIA